MCDLGRCLPGPAGLKDIGMHENDLESACALALAHPNPNPRSLEREVLRALLEQAFHDIRPN